MKKKKQKPKEGRHPKTGRFLPGFCPNPKGGPRKGEAKLDRLLDAVDRVQNKLNKSILDHFVERAFKKDIVLIALMKKLIPDLKAIQIEGYLQEGMTSEKAKQIRQVFKERFDKIMENHAHR